MVTAVIAATATVAAAFFGGGAFFKWLTDRKAVQADGWMKLYSSYDARLDKLNAQFGALEQELKHVKEALDREEKRSDAAISYIRVLRRWIGERYPHEDVPEVPDSLRNDV